MAKDIVPAEAPPQKDVALFNAPHLLSMIRPAWQSRNLVGRVKKILPADPSSACQRIFNAATHDLREKVVIAGIDLAKEAAKSNRLPPVDKDVDILDSYSVSHLIDLAYHMGLLSRPEWRRLTRCYEIRRDLEHEDDEYEADYEDCVYMFKTCIEVVLAKDPLHLIRVIDVKDLVEQSTSVAPSQGLMVDYEGAPQPRQEEIQKFLVSNALNTGQSDIVRQNCLRLLTTLEPLTKNPVKISVGKMIQEKIGQGKISAGQARVASASGTLPYLKVASRREYFDDAYKELKAIGHHWTQYNSHGEPLDTLIEVGGLAYCPTGPLEKLVKWLVLAYLGETGGVTSYGNLRPVYYSNSAAHRVPRLLGDSASVLKATVEALSEDKDVKKACQDKNIARRYEELVDIVSEA